MKEYPSISKDIRTDINIFAFDKLDGSNIRAEWSPKRGFYKFGTKTQMLGEDHPMFGGSIKLIRDTYEEGLAKVFQAEKYQSVVAFFEYYGANSFAGHHIDIERKVTLIDVSPLRKSILEPSEFIDLYGHLGIPNVCYYGKANNEFVQQVRDGILSGMTFEGVICKAKSDTRDIRPIMFKIKNQAWLTKLKEHCKEDLKLFESLV